MQSNKTVYYSYKYAPIAIGFFFIFFPTLAHLDPENATFNGEPGPPDVWTTIIFILVGILIALISFLFTDKLVIVEMNHQMLSIKKGDKVIEVNWVDIENMKMLPAFFPPLYKLRLKEYEGYFLFNTSRWGAQVMGFTWDWSDMGDLIKKKKKELGI
jgi:hypothetical protein